MKISSDAYFSLALPGFLLFTAGMFIIPNRLFNPEFTKVNKAAVINEQFLLKTTLAGIFMRVLSDFFPGELGFFIYLMSMTRFVGAFSLFASNTKKFAWLVLLTLLIELFNAFRDGMYHDAIMWIMFFALFFVYTKKPSNRIKLFGVSRTTIQNWLEQEADLLSDPVIESNLLEIEFDEMWHFINSKKRNVGLSKHMIDKQKELSLGLQAIVILLLSEDFMKKYNI